MDIEKFFAETPSAPLPVPAGAEATTGTIDLTRARQFEISRDTYLEAEANNMTLSELLETDAYDPSPQGSPLDAFERQLAVRGIRVAGANPLTVELFYRGAPALLPEFMLREIRRGQAMRPEVPGLVASTARVPGNRYTPFDVDASVTDTRWSMRPLGEGGNVPAVLVTERLHSIDVPDYGLALKASYKALRHRSTLQFRVLLWYIGYRMQVDKLGLLVDVLLNGDGNNNPAGSMNSGTSGALTYADLVRFWSELHPFELNTLICSKDMITTILSMNEFRDPMAGFRFQATGELISPLGAILARADTVATSQVIGMDKRFAAEEVVTQPLTVEYDKIIEQRFEEAVISESVAYAKVIPEAVHVLETAW